MNDLLQAGQPDDHPFFVIRYGPFKTIMGSQLIHGRPKSNSLDLAL